MRFSPIVPAVAVLVLAGCSSAQQRAPEADSATARIAASATATPAPVTPSPSPSPSPVAQPARAIETVAPTSTPGHRSVTPTPVATPVATATAEPSVAPTAAPHSSPRKASSAVPQEPPDAAPRIVSLKLDKTVVRAGETVSGIVRTSSNVASVEARIADYSIDVPKIAPGEFAMSYPVPNVPFFLRKTYQMTVIARNTAGEETTTSVPITIR